MKTCSVCKESKDESQFNKDARRKDGLHIFCRSCHKVKVKAYREKRRETLVIEEAGEKACKQCGETKPFSEFHVCSVARDGRKTKCAACTAQNVKERYLKDVEASREMFRQASRRSKERYPLTYLLAGARRRAKENGWEFSITKEDLETPDVCPVLGIPLSWSDLDVPKDYRPSLDRVDNTKGYVPGNVVVISWRANVLKRDATAEELGKIVSYMERHSAARSDQN